MKIVKKRKINRGAESPEGQVAFIYKDDLHLCATFAPGGAARFYCYIFTQIVRQADKQAGR